MASRIDAPPRPHRLWAIACVAWVSVACGKQPAALPAAAGTGAGIAGSGGSSDAQRTNGNAATQPEPRSGSAAVSGLGGAGAAGRSQSGPAAGSAAAAANGDASGAAAGTGAASGTGAAADGGAAIGGAGSDAPRPKVTAAADTTLVKLDPNVQHPAFEGFGTSLCWWANHVGGWSLDARNAVVDAVVDPVDGLGYNVFRYNIGGGENPSHRHMEPFKAIPGFQPSAGTWNWDADANQVAVLQRIVERGRGVILEAFSNSPPHWMTKSGCASGSSDGSNNLKDDAYDAFADYLTEVVKHFRDALKITFRTLEPLNEPNANWWTANGRQEGCHFSPSNQQQIIRAVSESLKAKGLTETVVSASDENSMDDALANLRGFDAMTLAAMGQINVHSYAGSRRAELRKLATSQAKRLWQSESGPLGQTLNDETDAALFMAGRIITDLKELQPEAWIDWQVGDPSRNWASVALDDSKQSFTPLKRFYMHAGFSRFIRPGASFVEVDNADMVGARSADGKTFALVVRNGDRMKSRSFTFDLTALPTLGAAAEVHRTSRTENLASLPAIPIRDWSFVAMVPPYSITTFVIPTP
jgi:O-glycosyl hydrolase